MKFVSVTWKFQGMFFWVYGKLNRNVWENEEHRHDFTTPPLFSIKQTGLSKERNVQWANQEKKSIFYDFWTIQKKCGVVLYIKMIYPPVN